MTLVTEMKVEVRFRPLILNVPEEREDVYNRVKTMLSKAEALAEHENVKIRLRAIEVVARLGMGLTGILKDVQLDEIEEALNEVEADAAVQQSQETSGEGQAETQSPKG